MSREFIEWAIARVLIPLAGLAGVVYEELQGTVSPELLLVYTGMIGYSIPVVRDILNHKTGGSS